MVKYRYLISLSGLLALSLSCLGCQSVVKSPPPGNESGIISTPASIITGAEQTGRYLPLLKDKKTALVANQTSVVGPVHLVDHLLGNGVQLVRIFSPEHGFRGEAGPGDKVSSGTDSITGLPVVSLYGSKRKPGKEDLAGIDIVIFDIQDVGARFYTYISTLHYMMEACAELGIRVIVFDRPNPNGFYVDGPVMEQALVSFVGVAPIPVVHGLTVGEYALMANGEKWLTKRLTCDLDIISMQNYTHSTRYVLPVKPSPNLPDMTSVYLYPTLCLFEGTKVSVGRGTGQPFKIAGFPGYPGGDIQFTPREIPGVIKDPPYELIKCSGKDFSRDTSVVFQKKQLMIEWVIEMYNAYPDKTNFFNNFFNKLAGNTLLQQQISGGMSAAAIRESWREPLEKYRQTRTKYLLYPD